MSVPLTIVIPTYNEEVNLPHALESVKGWADQIIVVDSFSTDKTVEVAKSYGVEVEQHAYENMAAQRMWGMNHPSIKYEWVFHLDADEQVSAELKKEIADILPNVSENIAGFTMRRKHIFMGRWMKHGGDYLRFLRLVKKNRTRIIKTTLLNEHTIVDGDVKSLRHELLHINNKTLTEWIERQNKGSVKYVLKIFQENENFNPPSLKSGEQEERPLRTWVNYRLYARLPLWLRPFARFIGNYFLRCGFLDGWQGFIYHTVNDFLYPFFVYAKYKELCQNEQARKFAEESKWR